MTADPRDPRDNTPIDLGSRSRSGTGESVAEGSGSEARSEDVAAPEATVTPLPRRNKPIHGVPTHTLPSGVPPRMPPEQGHIDRLIYPNVTVGEGYAVGHIEDVGGGYGFRKIRKGLGVTAFGVNVLVRPPGYETKWHYHDIQEELYFVHRGSIEMAFADGTTHLLTEGTFARVDASTPRKIKVLGPGETIYLCAGGHGGYIGHDGRTPEGL